MLIDNPSRSQSCGAARPTTQQSAALPQLDYAGRASKRCCSDQDTRSPAHGATVESTDHPARILSPLRGARSIGQGILLRPRPLPRSLIFSLLLSVTLSIVGQYHTYAADLARDSSSFNFHNYDKLKTREEKERSALREINEAFPVGSHVGPVKEYFAQNGGACQTRTYVPPADRAVMVGDNLYCSLDYQSPDTINPLFRVRWSVGVRYDKNTENIQKITVGWERYSIGG